MRRDMGAAILAFLACGAPTVGAAEFVLVDKGVCRAPIVLTQDAPAEIAQAAEELAAYVEKISGARPSVIVGSPQPPPASAVWIGVQPGLAALFPDVKLDFQHPEEILIACNGQHLLIAGRDRMVGDKQTEFGTVNAVYTFLQKHLGVRWLWPGPVGEDVVRSDTIALSAMEYRFHPPFRVRHLWPGQPKEWYRRQRLQPFYSLQVSAGHAFGDWWEKYHEQHPDYFALGPNGTRNAPRLIHEVKLCVSNPAVQAQWLDNAVERLRAEPARTMLSASPNDGGGACFCERCEAWDHPDGPPIKVSGKDHVALTDRYVKFWNIVARGLRARLPDREVYVGAHAYDGYMTPPVAEVLERNIAISYVGVFPLTSEASRQQQKADWMRWAEKASMMVYRPNLWYWCGGVWGLPEVAMKKTVEDFRFLAEHRCVGLQVDTVRGHWSTQGPQYYLMAQLAYDPRQDGAAVMKDYYRRAFGPAAGEMETYWTLMEEARDAVAASPAFTLGSRNRFRLPAILQQAYSEAFFDRADGVMRQAEAKVAEGPEIYRKRVAFMRPGLDFTRRMLQNIPLMARVRASGGKDAEAVRHVVENWEAMKKLSQQAGPFGIGYTNILRLVEGKAYMGGMYDYLGPPSEKFRQAAGLP